MIMMNKKCCSHGYGHKYPSMMKMQCMNKCCKKCSCPTKCCPQYKKMPECPEKPMLANAYVPFQHIKDIFNPMRSLEEGTAFPELVRPYSRKQSQYINMYLQQTKSPCEEEVCPYGN